MYEDYYSEPDEHPIAKHSGFGIASFIITLATGAWVFVLIVIAGVLETTTPGGVDENSPLVILLGLAMFGGLFVDLMGITFGIIGLFQSDQKKLFAILGVIFGFLVIVGFLFVLLIGLLAG